MNSRESLVCPRSAELISVPNAVGLSRRLVGEWLRHWGITGEIAESTQLITSELVTNAVRVTEDFYKAAGLPRVGRVRLNLRWTAPSLFTEVWDINPLLPVRKEAGEGDESGRGLELIEFLCRDWGAYYAEQGKIVWAEQRI